MISSIAKSSKSLLVKILVGIIILPFLFWGMGDVFRGGNQNIIAKLDKEKINVKDFVNYINTLNLSDEQRTNLNQTDLAEKLLSEFIGKKIIELEIKKYGINLTDKTLRDIIIKDEGFFENGKFSRTKYEEFLLKSGITAPMFEKNVIQQEKKRQLLSLMSSGILIPKELAEIEYNMENKTKEVDYIDLKNFYNSNKPSQKEIKNIFDENKRFFFEEFKSFNFVELKPINLTGKKDYEEIFFKKIDNIENNILDGLSFKEIVDDLGINFLTLSKIDKRMQDKKGEKQKIVNKEIFETFYNSNNLKTPKIISIKNKYYLFEITNIDKYEKTLKDKDVYDMISSQIAIKKKFENAKKLNEKIIKGEFKKEDMSKFASKNKLVVNNLKITGINDNKIFKKKIIEKIFRLNDGDIAVITDGVFKDNYIVLSKKTNFKKLDIKSDNYSKYQNVAKLRFTKDVYNLYDQSINGRYKIEINEKVLKRVKNSY